MARAGTSTIVCLTPLSQANTTHSSVKMGPHSLHNCEQSPLPPALLPIFLHWLAQLGCPACYWIVHWPYGPKFYIARSIFHMIAVSYTPPRILVESSSSPYFIHGVHLQSTISPPPVLLQSPPLPVHSSWSPHGVQVEWTGGGFWT